MQMGGMGWETRVRISWELGFGHYGEQPGVGPQISG